MGAGAKLQVPASHSIYVRCGALSEKMVSKYAVIVTKPLAVLAENVGYTSSEVHLVLGQHKVWRTALLPRSL